MTQSDETAAPVHVPHELLRAFCAAVLQSRAVREDVAQHVTDSLLQTSLRGVDSHGLELLPHYIRALDGGRLNPAPDYQFHSTAPAVALLDADHTLGHAAGGTAMLHAVELARATGVGAVAVYNSSHYGAAAYYSLLAAEQQMIGINCTHADPIMKSHGGSTAFFGTNAICFAAPCADEEPFCLDMATTLVSWNKIRLYRQRNEPLPPGWAFDAAGAPTTDPHQAVSLAPIGDYKGFGLSMMVDILCSLLTGMPYGTDISSMYNDPLDQKRYLGHFFLALDISRFTEIDVFTRRLKAMMDTVRHEPALDSEIPVMVAGDPQKQARAARLQSGIPLSPVAWGAFRQLAEQIAFQPLIAWQPPDIDR